MLEYAASLPWGWIIPVFSSSATQSQPWRWFTPC